MRRLSFYSRSLYLLSPTLCQCDCFSPALCLLWSYSYSFCKAQDWRRNRKSLTNCSTKEDKAGHCLLPLFVGVMVWSQNFKYWNSSATTHSPSRFFSRATTMANLLHTWSAEKGWFRISTKYTASYCIRPHASYSTSCGHPEIDFFNDAKFAKFKSSLNAEMTHLRAAALGSKKNRLNPSLWKKRKYYGKRKSLETTTPKHLQVQVVLKLRWRCYYNNYSTPAMTSRTKSCRSWF